MITIRWFRLVGCRVGAVVVDAEREPEWRALLHGGTQKIFTTRDARACLLHSRSGGSGTQTGSGHGALEPDRSGQHTESGDGWKCGEAPVACLLSFGSTGTPKPLWYDAVRWSEWSERCPPESGRARKALARRSGKVLKNGIWFFWHPCFCLLHLFESGGPYVTTTLLFAATA